MQQYWDNTISHRVDELRIQSSCPNIINAMSESLQQYGFAVLSGVISTAERETAATQLLALSQRLGTILPQSPRREMIEDIRDFSDVDERDDRGYRSAGELTPHSDPPSLIGLHCLQPAKSGGESYFVSVRAIHDAIRDEAPELLAVLFQGFPFWRVEGMPGGPGPAETLRPVLMEHQGVISCVYYRPFIELAAKTLQKPLTQQQVAALDCFDHFANDERLALRFHLQSGDTVFLHNRVALHARTDYEDWPDPGMRRHLLRVWVDAPELMPIAAVHELGDIFAGTL